MVNTADCGSVMQGFDSLISPHYIVLKVGLLYRVRFFNGGLMKEQDLDSSKNSYLKEKESSNYTKQVNWEMAIGLQKVDKLNPLKVI